MGPHERRGGGGRVILLHGVGWEVEGRQTPRTSQGRETASHLGASAVVVRESAAFPIRARRAAAAAAPAADIAASHHWRVCVRGRVGEPVAAVPGHLADRWRALIHLLTLLLLLLLLLLITIVRVRYAGQGGGGHDDRRRHGEHEEARDEKSLGNPRKRGVGGSGGGWQVNRWGFVLVKGHQLWWVAST